MNFQQIYMVVMLADLKNFSQAAEACFISQSTFSRNIQQIEKELGVKLFVRKKDGAHLTPEGKTFVSYSRNLLQHYGEMRTKIKSETSHEKDYIIGLLNVCNIKFILPLLTAYTLQQKDFSIAIHEVDWQSLQTKMQTGQFDAVFSWKETLPENIVQYTLAEDYVVLIAAKDHPLAMHADTGAVSIADICHETFILSSPTPPTKVIDQMFNTAGFKPSFFHSAAHPCSMLHMVKQKLGVGIIANSTYEYIQDNEICKIPIAEGYTFQYAVCFLDPKDARSKHMIQYFDKVLSKE